MSLFMDKFKFSKLIQCMCQLAVFVNGCKFNILTQCMCECLWVSVSSVN